MFRFISNKLCIYIIIIIILTRLKTYSYCAFILTTSLEFLHQLFFPGNVLSRNSSGDEEVKHVETLTQILQAACQSFESKDINIFKYNLAAMKALHKQKRMFYKVKAARVQCIYGCGLIHIRRNGLSKRNGSQAW